MSIHAELSPKPDIAPRLLKTRIITTDQEALHAAQEVAEFAKLDAQQNDQNRLLPWKAVEKFTALGLGGIRIPKQYGGARVSHKHLQMSLGSSAKQIRQSVKFRKSNQPAQWYRDHGDGRTKAAHFRRNSTR